MAMTFVNNPMFGILLYLSRWGMVHGLNNGEEMSADPIRLTPRLCRAARALLDWQQQQLADASGVPKPTITAFEAKRDTAARMTTMNNRAVVGAFEKAGLVFIPENGGGAGMRLRDRGEV
jgi:DNA-binding XRE family transcriptional regulator